MTGRLAEAAVPAFCFACSKRLPESLVCERCGADSSGWQEWVPIAVCMNGHVVEAGR